MNSGGEFVGKPTQRTFVSGEFACRTGPVELDTTDTAYLILGHIPVPGGDSIPFFQLDFHFG